MTRPSCPQDAVGELLITWAALLQRLVDFCVVHDRVVQANVGAAFSDATRVFASKLVRTSGGCACADVWVT